MSAPQETDTCQYDLGNLMICNEFDLPIKRAKYVFIIILFFHKFSQIFKFYFFPNPI
jgi:hypothetical protein